LPPAFPSRQSVQLLMWNCAPSAQRTRATPPPPHPQCTQCTLSSEDDMRSLFFYGSICIRFSSDDQVGRKSKRKQFRIYIEFFVWNLLVHIKAALKFTY
jgi:hypothetical protein